MPQRKTITRWAVHKKGTEQLGYLCSFEQEAIDMLNDLHNNIVTMPQEELDKYEVVKVDVSWDEI